MRGGDADPDREFADRQVARAVDAARIEDREALAGLAEHALAFGFRQRGVGLVAQARRLRGPALWSRTQPSKLA